MAVLIVCSSLPGNIDQPELARLLSLHLSEHAQVKNVKVVRDSKGGVCAFVQCEVCSLSTAYMRPIVFAVLHLSLLSDLLRPPGRSGRD